MSAATSGTPLPFVLSVPHGGRGCPEELEDRTRLLEHDLFEDSDAFTNVIYDLGDDVVHVEIASIARAYVDLNRAPDDLPPANPDGVVKSMTDHEVPIYADGEEPDPSLVARLLSHYHLPYHEALTAAARDPRIAVGLDCHSMEPYPPPIAPDAGHARPTFCLSNGGGETCSPEMLSTLADAIAEVFDIGRHTVAQNDPFGGGWITRSHARTDGIPWIQIEMNRSLYLAPPWFDESRLQVEESRLGELRGTLLSALERFAARIG